MGLKDELVEKRKKQAEDKKISKLKEQEDFNKQLEDSKKEYHELDYQVKQGNIPTDWEKIYDKHFEMVKNKLDNYQKDEFNFDFPFTEELYKEYFYMNNMKLAPYSKGNLLNKYLNKRFAQEGFSNSKFELTFETECYPTDAEQHAYDSAMRTYEGEYTRWAAHEPSTSREVIAGEIVVHKNPYKKPIEPTLSKSLREYKYYVRVAGNINSSKKKLADKLTVIFGAIVGGALGIAFWVCIGYLIYKLVTK